MPTSTNLGLVTPASTDFVMNGATNMTTLANGVDAFFGAPTVYTPTFTNVTGGAGDFRYRKIGRLGFIIGDFSAGTATAAGVVNISLPAGWQNVAVLYPVSAFHTTTGVILCTAPTSGLVLNLYSTAAGANWGAGASLSPVSFSAVLQLAS